MRTGAVIPTRHKADIFNDNSSHKIQKKYESHKIQKYNFPMILSSLILLTDNARMSNKAFVIKGRFVWNTL